MKKWELKEIIASKDVEIESLRKQLNQMTDLMMSGELLREKVWQLFIKYGDMEKYKEDLLKGESK